MRKFKIVNCKGASWDLNRQASFFHTISGLGFVDSTTFEQIGNMFLSIDEGYDQGQINGEMLFAGENPYFTYREFASFIRFTPLILVYELDEEFMVPIRVMRLEKGELSNGGKTLKCSI